MQGPSGTAKFLDPTIPVSTWSIDDVCQWVGTQPFRVFRGLFRDGMVNGLVMLRCVSRSRAHSLTIPLWYKCTRFYLDIILYR